MLLFLLPLNAQAQAEMTVKPSSDGSMIDMATAEPYDYKVRFTNVKKAGNSLIVTFQVSNRWPSIDLAPGMGKRWDLTGYDGVRIEMTNKSGEAIKTFAYITNPGDDQATPKRNSAKMVIGAGSTQTLEIPFDASQYDLDKSMIDQVKIFVGALNAPAEYEIHSVKAFKYDF